MGTQRLRSRLRCGQVPRGLPTHQSPKNTGVAASWPHQLGRLLGQGRLITGPLSGTSGGDRRRSSHHRRRVTASASPLGGPGLTGSQVRPGPRKSQGPGGCRGPQGGGGSSELPRPGSQPSAARRSNPTQGEGLSRGLAVWEEGRAARLQELLPEAVMQTPLPYSTPLTQGEWRELGCHSPPAPARGKTGQSQPPPLSGNGTWAAEAGGDPQGQPGMGRAGRGVDHCWPYVQYVGAGNAAPGGGGTAASTPDLGEERGSPQQNTQTCTSPTAPQLLTGNSFPTASPWETLFSYQSP